MAWTDEELSGIDAAIQPWRQGDYVLGEQWFVARARPEDAPGVPEGDGLILIEEEVRGLLVLTQTCDIVRAYADRPYVEVAPLVEMPAEELPLVERGRRPQYASLPPLAEMNLAVDLDRVMTIRKSVLAQWERRSGCATDDDARTLAEALARKRARFAFPDDFVDLVEPLRTRLIDKHAKQSAEGSALRALREIRVRAAPSWSDEEVDLLFWFIRAEDDHEERGWPELLGQWLQLVPAGGRFSQVDGQIASVDDMTARDYVESDRLDLDHLSVPRP